MHLPLSRCKGMVCTAHAHFSYIDIYTHRAPATSPMHSPVHCPEALSLHSALHPLSHDFCVHMCACVHACVGVCGCMCVRTHTRVHVCSTHFAPHSAPCTFMPHAQCELQAATWAYHVQCYPVAHAPAHACDAAEGVRGSRTTLTSCATCSGPGV